MYDKIEKLGNSVIQHGKFNDRIYLMKAGPDDPKTLMDEMEKLAMEKEYTKIFAKVPAPFKKPFEAGGYNQEAWIPGYFKGETDVFFLSKFLSPQRAREQHPDKVSDVLEKARTYSAVSSPPEIDPNFRFEPADESHPERIVEVFKVVFKTYPFPIHEPEYILKTMRDNVAYFMIWDGDKLAAVSSSEMDKENLNVEMTDFATLPDYRGKKLALFLLCKMEEEMKRRGFKTAYTIARAYSFGMNITFARMGYEYTGALVNNTNISGKIESMNIWYKPL